MKSERLSRFLRFAVEQALAGHEDQLKEYTIGVEVFDRSASYDPRIDPCPASCEAGRSIWCAVRQVGGAAAAELPIPL